MALNTSTMEHAVMGSRVRSRLTMSGCGTPPPGSRRHRGPVYTMSLVYSERVVELELSKALRVIVVDASPPPTSTNSMGNPSSWQLTARIVRLWTAFLTVRMCRDLRTDVEMETVNRKALVGSLAHGSTAASSSGCAEAELCVFAAVSAHFAGAPCCSRGADPDHRSTPIWRDTVMMLATSSRAAPPP